MKKLNFAIFGALMLTCLTTRALADTTIPWTKEGCESVKGTWITAHSPTDDGCDAAHCNGLNFCRSNVDMNWWSAFIWCQSIGHKLVTLANLCPGIPSGPNSAQKACLNAYGVDNAQYRWTSMPWSTNMGLIIGSAGDIRDNATRNWAGCRAVCEE